MLLFKVIKISFLFYCKMQKGKFLTIIVLVLTSHGSRITIDYYPPLNLNNLFSCGSCLIFLTIITSLRTLL